MNVKDGLNPSFQKADMIVNGYLGDLTDAELMVRPVEGSNHTAWQLGHLIASEHMMVEQVCPGVMPPLPDGFADNHKKETAGSDDPKAFLSKEEYMKLFAEQRAGTLKALDQISEDELDKPGPEALRMIAPTVAGIFAMQPTHWLMHAGQWAITRRKLGRPPLF